MGSHATSAVESLAAGFLTSTCAGLGGVGGYEQLRQDLFARMDAMETNLRDHVTQ